MSKDECLQVLGLTQDANLTEIKKAYRKLALTYHPDKNSDPKSKEIFLLVNEAYQRLKDNDFEFVFPSTTSQPVKNEREQKREERRKRAQEANRKRYEEYINSKQYKIDLSLSILGYQLTNLGILFFFLITLPTIILPLITVYLTYDKFREDPSFIVSPKLSIKALKILNQETYYVVFGSFVLNLFLSLFVIFDVFIPTQTLLSLYFFPVLIGFVLSALNRFKKSWLLTSSVIPFVFTFILILNSIFSFNPKTETYKFKRGVWFYQLENNRYQEFYLIRLMTKSEKTSRQKIQFTTKNGLFGIRVKQKTEIF